MRNTQNRKGITTKYALDFKCIGPDCPDNCCHDWNITIARKTYGNLKKVLPGNQIKVNFTKIKKSDANNYASINMRDDGMCTFLDPSDSLCIIHKKYGESCLGDTCKSYPRQLAMIGDNIELGLSLSCPEAARLCLLYESSTDLTAFNPEELLKKGTVFSHAQSSTPANHYQTYINDFREIILQLLTNRNYPFESRLFIVLYLSKQLSEHVYDGVKNANDEVIAEELDNLLAPGYMDSLHNQLIDLPQSIDFSMSLIQSIILGRVRPKGMLTNLISNILGDCGIKAVFLSDAVQYKAESGNLSVALEAMLTKYQQRRDTLKKTFGAEIDQYLENYSKNFWFKDLFVKSPSLLSHMQNLIIRIAVVKFLFFSNPDLNGLIDSPEDYSPAVARKVLDDVAVKTFYQFSRGIEHDQLFLTTIQEELNKQEMDSFAHFVLLLKF